MSYELWAEMLKAHCSMPKAKKSPWEIVAIFFELRTQNSELRTQKAGMEHVVRNACCEQWATSNEQKFP